MKEPWLWPADRVITKMSRPNWPVIPNIWLRQALGTSRTTLITKYLSPRNPGRASASAETTRWRWSCQCSSRWRFPAPSSTKPQPKRKHSRLRNPIWQWSSATILRKIRTNLPCKVNRRLIEFQAKIQRKSRIVRSSTLHCWTSLRCEWPNLRVVSARRSGFRTWTAAWLRWSKRLITRKLSSPLLMYTKNAAWQSLSRPHRTSTKTLIWIWSAVSKEISAL